MPVRALSSKHAPAAFVLALLLLAPSAGADPPHYGLTVDVTLSPKAAKLLETKHERVTVSAMYLGFPTASNMKKAAPDGTIPLGSEEITLPGSGGRAVVTGSKVITARVAWVKSLLILINVYSARLSDPDNLLDCDAFEQPLAKVHDQVIPIHCKLIDERS